MAQNTVEILIKLVDQASKEFDAIKAGGAGLEAALKSLPKTFSEIDAALSRSQAELKAGVISQTQYRDGLESVRVSLAAQVGGLDKASSAYGIAVKHLGDVSTELKQVDQQLSRQNLSWATLGKTVKGEFADGVKQGSSLAANNIQNLGAQFGALTSPIGLASAGLGLAAAGTVALGAEMVHATNVAQGFEHAVDGASAVLKASAEDSARLAESAKTLGTDLTAGAIGATKAAEVIEQLGSSGLETADILNGGLKAALTTAAATGVNDFTKVAEVVAGTKAAFGLLPADLPKVSDLITNAMNVSQLKVNSFAEALAAGGSSAKTAGVGMYDFTAIISLMSDRLIQGSDAGTSFKGFMAALTPNTDKARDAMKALNLDFYDANGKMKSLEEITKMLTSAFSGMTQKQRDTNAEIIFGSDGVRVFNTLLDVGVQGLSNRTDALKEMGNADEAAKTRMDNAEGAQKNLNAAVENFNIAIGKGLLPLKTNLLNFLADMAKKFTGIAGDADLATEALRKFNQQKAKTANIDPGLEKGNQLVDAKNRVLDLQKQLAATPKDALLFAVINAKLQEQIALVKQLQSELSKLYSTPAQTPTIKLTAGSSGEATIGGTAANADLQRRFSGSSNAADPGAAIAEIATKAIRGIDVKGISGTATQQCGVFVREVFEKAAGLAQGSLRGSELFGGSATESFLRFTKLGLTKALDPKNIDLSQLRVGDILFKPMLDAMGREIGNGHIGIYQGNGRVAENYGLPGQKGNTLRVSDLKPGDFSAFTSIAAGAKGAGLEIAAASNVGAVGFDKLIVKAGELQRAMNDAQKAAAKLADTDPGKALAVAKYEAARTALDQWTASSDTNKRALEDYNATSGRTADRLNKVGSQADLTGAQVKSLAKDVYPLVLALEQANKANDPAEIGKRTAALTDWKNAHKNAGEAVSLAREQVQAYYAKIDAGKAEDKKATEEAKARAASITELSIRLRNLNEDYRRQVEDGKAGAHTLEDYDKGLRQIKESGAKLDIVFTDLSAAYRNQVGPLEASIKAHSGFAVSLETSMTAATNAIKAGGKAGLEGALADLNKTIKSGLFVDLDKTAQDRVIKLRESVVKELEKVAGFDSFQKNVKIALNAAGRVLESGDDGQIAAQVKRLEEIIGRADFKKLPQAAQESVRQTLHGLKGEPAKRFSAEFTDALAAASRALESGTGLQEALDKLDVLMQSKKYPGLADGTKAGGIAAIQALEDVMARGLREQGFDIPINVKPTLSQVVSMKPDLERIVGPISTGLTEALIAGDWKKFGDKLSNLTGEQFDAMRAWVLLNAPPELAATIQEVLERAAKDATAKPISLPVVWDVTGTALSEQVAVEMGDIADLTVSVEANLGDVDGLKEQIAELKRQAAGDYFETDAGKLGLEALIQTAEGYVQALDDAQASVDELYAAQEAAANADGDAQEKLLELTKEQTEVNREWAEQAGTDLDKLANDFEKIGTAQDIVLSVDITSAEGIQAALDQLDLEIKPNIQTDDGLAELATLRDELLSMKGAVEDTLEIPVSTDEASLARIQYEFGLLNEQYKNGSISASEYLDGITALQSGAGDLAGVFGDATDQGRDLAQLQTDLASGAGTASDALTDQSSSFNQANGALEEYTGGIDEHVQALADQNEANERQRQSSAEILTGLEEKIALEARAVETARALGNSSDDIAFRLGKGKAALEATIAVLPVGSDLWKKYTADLKAVQNELDSMPIKIQAGADAQVKSAGEIVQAQNEQFKTAQSLGASNEELQAILKNQIGDLEQLKSHTEVGSKEWFIYAEALAKARGEAVKLAEDGLKKIMTGIQQVAGFVTSAANAIKSFSEGGSKDVLGLVGSLTKIGGSIVELVGKIPGLGAVVSAVVDAVTAVVDMAVSAVVGGNKKISEEGHKAAEDAYKIGKEYASSMNAAAGQGFVDLGNRINDASNIAGDFWTNLFNKDWANANADLAGKLTEIKNMAQATMQGAGQAMAAGLKEAINSGDLEDAKRLMLEKLYGTLVNTIITAAAAAALAMADVDKLIIEMSEKIKNGDWDGAMAVVDQITDKAGAAFGTFAGKFAGKLKNPYSKEEPKPQDGSIAKLEEDKAKLETKYRKATSDEERARLTAEIDAKEAEIKRLKGSVKTLAPDGSIAALEEQKRVLEEQRTQATNQADRDRLKLEIAAKDAEIKRLKGEVDSSKTDSSKTDTTKRNTVGGSYASVTSLVASLPAEWLSSFNIFEGSVNKFDGSVNRFDSTVSRFEAMYRQVDGFYASLRLNGISAYMSSTPAPAILPSVVYTK